MVFGVIMILLAIILTLYIVFSAVKMWKNIIRIQGFQNIGSHELFTTFIVKVTVIVSLGWWLTLLLKSFMSKNLPEYTGVAFMTYSIFFIIVIISILGFIFFRNIIYRKYLTDNIVKVIYIEYTLSFITGTLYAYMISHAIRSALFIF